VPGAGTGQGAQMANFEHLHEIKDLFDHLRKTKDLFDHLRETKDLGFRKSLPCPSFGNGMSVPKHLFRKRDVGTQKEVSSRPERTRISCHAALDKTASAPFRKEGRMKCTKATKGNPG
jgi:hypothetical protein